MSKILIKAYYNEKKKYLTALRYKIQKQTKKEIELVDKHLKETEEHLELLSSDAQNGQMIKESNNWHTFVKNVRQNPKLKFDWFKGEYYTQKLKG